MAARCAVRWIGWLGKHLFQAICGRLVGTGNMSNWTVGSADRSLSLDLPLDVTVRMTGVGRDPAANSSVLVNLDQHQWSVSPEYALRCRSMFAPLLGDRNGHTFLDAAPTYPAMSY